MKELIDSERGRAAKNKYLVVARAMKEYEDQLYQNWVEHQDLHLASYLKRTILRTGDSELTPDKPEVAVESHELSMTPGGEERMCRSVAADQSEQVFVSLPPSDIFIVNFAHELNEIIQETKYLEQLGYAIPELARNVALQEESYIKSVPFHPWSSNAN